MLCYRFIAGCGFALAILSMTGVSAQESGLTRIEPRPYYGATITIEEGVRVYRPLPPHSTIIINPDHKTPLSVGVKHHATRYAPQTTKPQKQ